MPTPAPFPFVHPKRREMENGLLDVSSRSKMGIFSSL